MASSLVGVSTMALILSFRSSKLSIIGRPNAAVLPVPVWAWAMTSWVFPSKTGITAAWISVGAVKPFFSKAAKTSSDSPSSVNDLIFDIISLVSFV